MGRSPRILIEGGIYHVYNRVSRGKHAFRDEAEAKRLLKRLVETKRRDGFQVLAWCLMSNHYHLALRMGEVPLSRSMRTLNQRYAQSFNGRHRVAGPFWQGRYRSKLVEDGAHLQQQILHIHRNPVTAGVVKDPADYRWSGHGEVLRGGRSRGLVDVDETLAAFEPTRRSALAHYRRAMAAEGEEWMRVGESAGESSGDEEGGGRGVRSEGKCRRRSRYRPARRGVRGTMPVTSEQNINHRTWHVWI